QPVMKELSLAELARGQVALYEAQDVSFTTDLGDDPDGGLVMGDAGLLRQALTNIIQNALDSLDGAGRADPQIRLAMTVKEGLVSLMISDNGPGFPQSDRASLLEPYVTKRDKGTGLGLAIVSKIIQDHSGELELADAQEGGACVVIKLPQYGAADVSA
ncbi:MAG: ATP-binding protein, partial [Pseudomonadota bacterium]|nr:ATP-binding protein [Pseudomonadota bacterium]